jgi:ADP-heptose:LPS heptosyltransferase
MSAGRGNNRLRQLDRYLGIPLVYLTGRFRRRRGIPPRKSQIGLLNTAAIGDTVLMSAVAADLRNEYPNASITLFAGPSNYHAGQMIEVVDRVERLEVFNPLASVMSVRRSRLDILMDFGPWSRLNSLITRCSGADFTIGFRTRGEYRHYGYDIAVEHGTDVHELENHRRLVRALGVAAVHAPSIRSAAHSALLPGGEPFVVLHMWPGGSGAELKEWPAGRWVELVNQFARDRYRMLLTGSPDQRRNNEVFISSLDPTIRLSVNNVAGASLLETSLVLSHASLVVSVNTGVMHMAAAVGVPLVALHGPTNAKRWGPVSERAVSIESPLCGCGYLNLGFEFPRGSAPACMEAISTDSVIQACHFAIERFASPTSGRDTSIAGNTPIPKATVIAANDDACKCGVSSCGASHGQNPKQRPAQP